MTPLRPINPTNGHGWDCKCAPCAIFWDSRAGAEEYAGWQWATGQRPVPERTSGRLRTLLASLLRKEARR